MLQGADYAVMAVYVLVVAVIGWRVTRRSPTADDLFLAGRSLGWGVVGLSLFASNISSTTLIGLPGAAWETGISVANYEWMAALVLVFSAFFIMPRLLRAGVTTVPEWLEQRFDGRLRRYLSAVSILLSIVLDTAGSLYAGAVVLMTFMPGLTLGWTCAAMAIFAGLYTVAGGLRAVVYTDVLQTVVLLTGSAILCGIVLAQFDFSWTVIRETVGADRLSLVRPLDDPAMPWLGLLIGVPVLGFYYWTMNQYVAQRILGARNVEQATKGALLAAGLKLLPLGLMVLPGALAVSLFTDLERGDQVFPTLIRELAPVGLAGLILSGLMAAIMSSVDSALNSASTLITVDFVRPRRPGMSAEAQARLGRWITLGLMVFAALWAPLIDRFPGLFNYLQQGFAYVTPPLVAVFLLGRFWPGLGSAAALRAVVIGHGLSAALFVAAQLDWHGIHFTIIAGALCLFTAGVAVVLQRLRSAADLALADDITPPQSATLKVLAWGLVALVGVLLVTFW
ncbi:sodium:solute symporter family transporter [Polycyclovorans algicola]|uniref:sodium:solute symporter family transporter n=1 Tax=Polycyclovorans algicola TaxID=616992 RepID=UPI0006948974|nr:sodium/solute symporter [Polycyclovorans algicola]